MARWSVGSSLLATVAVAAGCEARLEDTEPQFREEHPRIYIEANRDRLTAELDAGGEVAQDYQHIVDRFVEGEDVYGIDGWQAGLLGQLTGDPKYCEAAVRYIDLQVISEENKIDSGDMPEVAHDSYLYVGDRVGDLALVYDWCNDAVSDGQKARWLRYANQAVFNVWHPDDAQWDGHAMPWSGWSIDNPTNNYHYSFLRATMLLGLATRGENDQADAWIDTFRQAKIEDELVPKFDANLVGGGSPEGMGYGVAMQKLWEIYDFWQASTGEDIADLTPHTAASIRQFMHATLPTLDRHAPTGDLSRDSTAALFDYHRNYLQILSFLRPSDAMVPKVKFLLDHSSVPAMTQSWMYVYDFLYDQSAVTASNMDGLGTAYFAEGIGEVYARSSWETDATWVNLIAGAYTESHAHQDQGAFMIYKGGWLAYDAVVDSRSGLRQTTDAHNLVRLMDGDQPIAMKLNTMSTVTALHHGDGWVHVAADLTPAYDGNPKVQKVQREMLYLQPDVVVVFDRVSTTGATQVWQMNSPVAASISGADATVTAGGHSLKSFRIGGPSVTPSVFDWSSDSDFTGGARYDEVAPAGTNTFLHVLSVDGAVTSAVAANAGGRTGATLTLGDGRTVTVLFSTTSVDGTLEITGAGAQTATLGVGVDSLPE